MPGLAVAAIVCVWSEVLRGCAARHARSLISYMQALGSLSGHLWSQSFEFIAKSRLFNYIGNRIMYKNTLIKYFGENKIFPPHSLKLLSQYEVWQRCAVSCHLCALR